MTPSPARREPPSDDHALVAPTYWMELTQVGWTSRSYWTATTPSTFSRSLALLAGSDTDTPP